MLLLTRKFGEAIRIGDDIEVVILPANPEWPHQARIGITAPPEVVLLREELLPTTHPRWRELRKQLRGRLRKSRTKA